MPSYRITRYNHPSQNWMEAVLALRAEFGDAEPEPFVSFITRRLEDETMLLILAWESPPQGERDRPVGYGLAFDVETDPAKPEWTRTGYISQFLVAESHRQKGVGAQLMEVVDAWFAERGLTKVLLNVNIDNPAGIRFWQKHGFEAYALRMKRVRKTAAKG